MFRPTIGLEIHAELATRTKMFCDSKNDPDETRPNCNICPICLAHPGTLPTINKEAVRQILRIGSALGGTLATYSEFDRKSYFYPDIPKGYQISQYAHPLVIGGALQGVAITRIHLEEDTARGVHEGDESYIDFNRAGVPLMELVTEPVICDAETAVRFARELQLLLRTLGAGEANLEKGEMRIEANVSVVRSDFATLDSEVRSLGTKVEVKNLNSFRSVERAIDYEIARQTKLIESGKEVEQETRGWNELTGETFHQRFKEGSADYRYFPEPDLPKLFISEISEFSPKSIRQSLPELPWERRERYAKQNISPGYIEIFLANSALGKLFDETVALLPSEARLCAGYIGTDIVGLIAKYGDAGLMHITAHGLSNILRQYTDGQISSRGIKETLARAYCEGGDIIEISADYLQESNDTKLGKIVDKVIADNAKAVAQYKEGKEAAIQFLIGMAMRESGGTGNPEILRNIIQQRIRQDN